MDKEKKKTRRTDTEMYPLIEAYESSEMTCQDFCASHGLKVATFYYWRSKYLSLEEESTLGFVSLVPEGLPHGDVILEYEGIVLRLGKEVSPDYVVSLVHKLADRC